LVSRKGGGGKTTAAIHIAAALSKKGKVLLVDEDPNMNASRWSLGGKLPFQVSTREEAKSTWESAKYIVVDTPARPDIKTLERIVAASDLLVLPIAPSSLSLDALAVLVKDLKRLEADNYAILLNIVPPPPSRKGEIIREMLIDNNLPVMKTFIKRLVALEKAVDNEDIVSEVKDPRAAIAWKNYMDATKEMDKLL
ncbi:MAG TPA: ParA family protein, partial [bacterium]|nr:ParA family protein [bacterium]